MAKTANQNIKVQNKKANQNKRTSFRVEKDARRAKRAEDNAPKITTYIAGEAVQVSSSSKQGKKILEKQKKRAAEAKADRRHEQRHARVSQDQVRDVLQGKRTGTTIAKLQSKLEAEKLAIADSSSKTTTPTPNKPMTAAQREIQEMLERSKRAQELEAKIAKLQAGGDISDEEFDDVEEEKTPPTKKKPQQQRVTAKQMKSAKQEQYRLKNKDYEDEEEINLGHGNSDDDIDSDALMVDSDEFESEGDDDNDMDEYEDEEDGSDNGNSDDSDYEVRQQYKEQHKTFLKNTKNMGEKKDVRAAMTATLYDDLPQYKPMPPKMAALLKSQGKNIKDVEKQRKSDHDLKIAKILADRERKIREYDSDDDDSDMEDDEDEAEYFLRKMAEQKERRRERQDAKSSMVDSSDDEDEDDEQDNRKKLNLINVKQSTKDERAQQKKELHELWLAQREERIANAMERTGETPRPTKQTTKQQQQQQQNAAPATMATTTTAKQVVADSEALRKKEQMKQVKAKQEQVKDLSKERLMVLLDDGTWGYREGDLESKDDDEPQVKPDLSAYVRAPKKSKKELKAEMREAKEALEEDPFEDSKTSNAMEKFETFMKTTQADNKKKAKVVKEEVDDDEDYGFGDDDDEYFDEDHEFETMDSDNDIDDIYSSSLKSKMGDDDELDQDGDEIKRLSAIERKKIQKQLFELNSFHTSRLDRIRQVQLILGQLCTELLENPHKYIVGGHLEALLKLCGNKDSTIQQLAIASTATVFADILPGYRIKYHQSLTHTGVNNSQRLTKDVRIMRTYENALLDQYKEFLGILNKYVHRGLSLFYAKQRILWNKAQAEQFKQKKINTNTNPSLGGLEAPKKPEVNPFEEYGKVNIDLAEKQSTLYTISLKCACQVFNTGYAFNFNTQISSLLSHVLTSDYLEWADIVTQTVSDVFKKDKCSEATHEIVQSIAEICKKRAGEKIRAPLLAVLTEIPFSYQVIHYKDPNQAKKDLKARADAKKYKEHNKVKGVTGAGHHYAQKMKEQQEKTMKQMKKALRTGKEYQGPDPNEGNSKTKSLHDLQLEVQKELKESEAVLSIIERQKLQTKCLSLVFTIFFRYLKQAPTIKTLYNYNTVNTEHQQQYDLLKQSFTAQSTVHKTAELLSIPKEHRNQVILTQTMLGIVTPPTHFVLAIVLKGIMRFGSLINVELVLDLLAHLLLVIQTATALESLPLSSSLLSLECIFTLLQMHGSAIDIDLAPHYQVLYNIIWQLLYHPEYSFLLIKCIDLSIIHRKHLSYRRVAAIVRRLFQVGLHLPPPYSLPLLQIASQCCTAHPTIGSVFDNDKMQSGLYDMGHPQPDTSDAIATPAWEALALAQAPHPYAQPITLHTLLSDLRLGTNTNVDGKTVGNSVDRSALSISLTTLELPNETNQLERPQRITRQIAVSRLKPLELYAAIDVSKGGFCPDVEAPDTKKIRKSMHYEWYDRHNWLAQVQQMKQHGMYNDFNLSYQSKLMNEIMGGEDTVSSFLEKPIEIGEENDTTMGDEDY